MLTHPAKGVGEKHDSWVVLNNNFIEERYWCKRLNIFNFVKIIETRTLYLRLNNEMKLYEKIKA